MTHDNHNLVRYLDRLESLATEIALLERDLKDLMQKRADLVRALEDKRRDRDGVRRRLQEVAAQSTLPLSGDDTTHAPGIAVGEVPPDLEAASAAVRETVEAARRLPTVVFDSSGLSEALGIDQDQTRTRITRTKAAGFFVKAGYGKYRLRKDLRKVVTQ